jgi:hypothetical protein
MRDGNHDCYRILASGASVEHQQLTRWTGSVLACMLAYQSSENPAWMLMCMLIVSLRGALCAVEVLLQLKKQDLS